MTPNALFLYATNTGRLYDTHMLLARQKSGLATWRRHVEGAVLPLYRKELHEPHEGMSADELEETANLLKKYYARHLAEA